MPVRSIRGLGTAVVILLGAQIALMAIEAITRIVRLGLINDVEAGRRVSESQAEGADAAVAAAAGVAGLLFLATVVVWCVWQHRAQRNAITLSSAPLKYTPGWAVGWWFIPFANLVMPFKTVRELWKASHGGAWQSLRTWSVIGWWWAVWLLSNIHIWFGDQESNFGFGTDSFREPTSLSGYASRDTWELVSLGLQLVAAVLAIVIVRAVVRLQGSAEPATYPAMPVDAPPLPEPPGMPPQAQ